PQLPTPESSLSQGDGGVSAASALRTREPPATGVPPARPARSSDVTLPLSRHRAGHHARTARCSVPRVLHHGGGRIQHRAPASEAARAEEPGRGPLMVNRTRLEIAMDFVARSVVCTLFLFLSVRLFGDFLRTGRLTGLLLLASEGLVVILTIIRRRAR